MDLKASTILAFINYSFWKFHKLNMEVMFLTMNWIFTDCFWIHIYLNDQINWGVWNHVHSLEIKPNTSSTGEQINNAVWFCFSLYKKCLSVVKIDIFVRIAHYSIHKIQLYICNIRWIFWMRRLRWKESLHLLLLYRNQVQVHLKLLYTLF